MGRSSWNIRAAPWNYRGAFNLEGAEEEMSACCSWWCGRWRQRKPGRVGHRRSLAKTSRLHCSEVSLD